MLTHLIKPTLVAEFAQTQVYVKKHSLLVFPFFGCMNQSDVDK